MRDANPPLGPWARRFAAVLMVVFITTCTLFFAGIREPAPWWPWPLAPFNARFLGAVYIAQTIDIALLLWLCRLSPGRLILAMGTVFGILDVATIALQPDYLDYGRPSAPFFVAFIVFTVAGEAMILWRSRHHATVGTPPPPMWRSYLWAMAALFGLYGVWMFAAPAAATAFWPWPVDAFHARAYSAVFTGNAIGAALLARRHAYWDAMAFGLSNAVFGALAIVSTLSVDAAVHRVDWTAAGTWLWLGLLAWVAVTGAAVAWRGRGLPGRESTDV